MSLDILDLWRQARASLLIGFVLIITACGGDDGSNTVTSPPPSSAEAKTLIIAETSRQTVSPGSPINFDVLVAEGSQKVEDFRWTFSDGQVLVGQKVTASFRQVGFITATVQALAAGGVVAEAETLVNVSDSTASPFGLFGIPLRPGSITPPYNGPRLVDALLISQARQGIRTFTSAEIDQADINLSSSIDEQDITLAMDAVLAETALPSALLVDRVYPGGIAFMVSPALIEVDGAISISVGGVLSPQVLRAVAGYASFLVPATLSNAENVDVIVLVDSKPVDKLSITILAPTTSPTPPAEDIRNFFAEIDRALLAHQNAIAGGAVGGGWSDAEVALLQRLSSTARAQFQAAQLEFERVLAGPNGGSLATLFRKALRANGLEEFRRSLAETLPTNTGPRPRAVSVSPEQICDYVIPSICLLKASANLVGTASTVMASACAATTASLFVAGAVIPADGPAIEVGASAAFVALCVPLTTKITIAAILGEIVEPIDLTMRLSAQPSVIKLGQTAQVKSEVNFLQLGALCGTFAAQGAGAAVTKIIGKRVVSRVLQSSTTTGTLARFFSRNSETLYVALIRSINDSAETVLDASGIADAIGGFVTNLCPVLPAGRAVMSASRVLKALGADQGSLNFNSDGTATYTCPAASANSPKQVTLIAEWKLCDPTPTRATVSVSCSASEITIVMGDNGSALDDIFEVVINGETVLTSSNPVRNASAVAALPLGRTEVVMRGLAAPDGIGTYFITFAGATLVSGDPLSGSDLTPGVTKRFTVEVK